MLSPGAGRWAAVNAEFDQAAVNLTVAIPGRVANAVWRRVQVAVDFVSILPGGYVDFAQHRFQGRRDRMFAHLSRGLSANGWSVRRHRDGDIAHSAAKRQRINA